MSKRRRSLFLFGLLAGMTVAVSLAMWLLWPRTSITRVNAAKIKLGMTESEVEAIMGGAARDESTGLVDPDWDRIIVILTDQARADDGNPFKKGSPSPSSKSLEWKSDDVYIAIFLNAEGRVEGTDWAPQRRTSESPLALLRRWLRL